jgi:mono/diheme cytochrome c family protein
MMDLTRRAIAFLDLRRLSLSLGIVLLMAFLAACGGQPAASEAPAATEAAAPTEAPAADPAPTEAPAEEATAEPTAEATEEATEEAAATGTPAAEAETAGEAVAGDVAAGGYIFTIARGCGCHFNRDLGAPAGGNRFETANGVVYASNITPHETGIGSMNAEDIVTILHTGVTPDGRQLSPIMPYANYSILSNEDALNLAAYLFSLDPVENAVPARELTEEPAPFTPVSAPAESAPTDPVARGQYLVQIANCSGCHTPRNADGSPNMDLFLAGNQLNEDETAWNITPHEATGIGTWSEEELANFMRTGKLADGSEIVGVMATQIERYFSKLTEDDAAAMAAYLMSLDPIDHDPTAP